jgi:hypothetical protein
MAIKSGIDSLKVESLNGINFRMWKRHISYVLTYERTLHTLTSSRLEIVDGNDGDDVKKREKWMEDDLMTRATLFHNI